MFSGLFDMPCKFAEIQNHARARITEAIEIHSSHSEPRNNAIILADIFTDVLTDLYSTKF